MLATATLLHHPDSNAKTSITVDASDRAVGGQLEQLLEGAWCPVAFFSRKLSNAERMYSTFDRELLAIFLAAEHFRQHIEGLPFTIFTDHKPLTFAFASAAEQSPRQTRHLSFVSEFSTNVLHVSGKDNVVTDALSRPGISAVSLSFASWPLTKPSRRKSRPTKPPFLVSASTMSSLSAVRSSAMSPWVNLVHAVVPREWTRRIFDAIHGLAHAGCHPTQHAIAVRFVWHGMKRDIRKWCRECHPCQASSHVQAPLTKRPP